LNVTSWQVDYYPSMCVYDDAGNVIETHEHKGQFKEW